MIYDTMQKTGDDRASCLVPTSGGIPNGGKERAMAMRKPAIWGATLCCCALGASLAACVPEVEQETTESSQSGAVELAGGEKPAAGLE